MTCSPISLSLYPHYPDAVGMHWEMIDGKLPGDFKVWVERSGSPDGEFERLNYLPILNSNEWVHQNQSLEILSKDRYPLYRVVVEYPNGKTYTSEVANLYGILSKADYLIAKELNRKESVRLKQIGIPLIILKRKHWGNKCEECIDVASGVKIKDFCDICYNTKFIGGYYSPIETTGEITVNAHHTDLDNQGLGVTEEYNCRMRIMNYPLINRDDVIIEKLTNIRWTTWEQQPIEWKRVPVVQQVVLRRVPPSSIVYRLEYSLEHMTVNGLPVDIAYIKEPWKKRDLDN